MRSAFIRSWDRRGFLKSLGGAAAGLAVGREWLPRDSRELRVLNLAVEKSGYGRITLPAGHVHRLRVHQSFDGYVAQVAEVSMTGGKLTVHRITTAVEGGCPVGGIGDV